jgi:DNA invertase Pin-like site-specific DNA recombinase
MMAKAPKIVALYRVSTRQQGDSGLGLAAQRKVVADYVAATGAVVMAEFEEIESGRAKERPELEKAIAKAKAHRATLCMAKLDRAGRVASEVLSLLDRPGLKVVFADNPNAGRLTLGVLACVAQEEAEAISTRTKAALAAAKERGTVLGNPNGARALLRHQAKERAKGLKGNEAGVIAAKICASDFARTVWSEIQPLIGTMSEAAIAAHLNENGPPTRREGGRWHIMSVRRIRARMAA